MGTGSHVNPIGRHIPHFFIDNLSVPTKIIMMAPNSIFRSNVK